jgi:hypothetical protein
MQAVHHPGLWSLPHTLAGKTSVVFAGAIVVIAGYTGLLLADGQRGGETFFDNLVLAIPALMMLGSAVLSMLGALVAVRYRSERSVLVYAALAFAMGVMLVAMGALVFPGQPFVATMRGWWL